MNHLKELILELKTNHSLEKMDYIRLLDGLHTDTESADFLMEIARKTALSIFGPEIFIRGLIEFTNYCRNDCYYCGIRRSNLDAERYRLTKSEILECCQEGYHLGFRTFVLQGGEDMAYSDTALADIIRTIRQNWPDCAITLSVGEREAATYRQWFEAGANRYLLRHETADPEHYAQLHPQDLSSHHRKNCLLQLKTIGYQTGTGFMVGSPGQTTEHLAKDLLFIQDLKPEMTGIGPFIPHRDTPFKNYPAGTLTQTLHLISILRLIHPQMLIPATTALGTIHPNGRELGILAGANVVMPNLSPNSVRRKYLLYDNKICTGEEAAEGLSALKQQIAAIGYQVSNSRGDYPSIS